MKAQVPQGNNVNDGDEKAAEKRPYAAPVLTKYGDIASLTRGSAGAATDVTTVSN
jgi:hypothetical protein